jgi:hypothetical protein
MQKQIRRTIITILLFFATTLCLGRVSLGQASPPVNTKVTSNVSLTWDASDSPNIVGYKVYIGTASNNYSNPITIGNQTYYIISGLTSGTYYFAVSAYDASNESDKSNEVVKFIPVEVPSVPTITLTIVPSITATTATIVWVTNIDCSGTVFYGTSTQDKFVKSNNLGTTNHLAVITYLTTKTHYTFRVNSVCGEVTLDSPVYSFNTK